jgi:hypothetical protein
VKGKLKEALAENLKDSLGLSIEKQRSCSRIEGDNHCRNRDPVVGSREAITAGVSLLCYSVIVCSRVDW